MWGDAASYGDYCMQTRLHSFYIRNQSIRNQHWPCQKVKKLIITFSLTKETSKFRYNRCLMSVEWNNHFCKARGSFSLFPSALNICAWEHRVVRPSKKISCFPFVENFKSDARVWLLTLIFIFFQVILINLKTWISIGVTAQKYSLTKSTPPVHIS